MKKAKRTPHKPQIPTKRTMPVIVEQHENDRYTAQQVVDALKTTQGMVSAAARMLGCNRKTLYRYFERYPAIVEAVKEATEFQLDVTELQLFQAIDRGEAWAICLYLKTKGRQRGYVEKQDVQADVTLKAIILAAMEKAT